MCSLRLKKYLEAGQPIEIDLANDDLITLKAASRLPILRRETGKAPHLATLTRWALKGRGPHRIKLEVVRVGRESYTTEAALHRYLIRWADSLRTTEPVANVSVPDAPATAAKRPREATAAPALNLTSSRGAARNAASRYLDEAGLRSRKRVRQAVGSSTMTA